MFLAANLDIELSTLCEAGVISKQELNQATESRPADNVILLRFMLEKPRQQFDKLLVLLEQQQQQQQHIVKHIRGEGQSPTTLISCLTQNPLFTTALLHSCQPPLACLLKQCQS